MKFLKIIKSSILCLRFPFLYPRNRFSGLHYTNWKMFNFVGNWKSQSYDIIWFQPTTEKKGWPIIIQRINDFRRNAFGIQMCKEIKTALKKNNCLRKYRITQIKEKYGSLRWYDTGAPEEVHKIISKYEQISAKTCIICGKSAKYISKGWISPYCENCIGNRNYTKIGEENYDEMV